jgi:hypothetical protein
VHVTRVGIAAFSGLGTGLDDHSGWQIVHAILVLVAAHLQFQQVMLVCSGNAESESVEVGPSGRGPQAGHNLNLSGLATVELHFLHRPGIPHRCQKCLLLDLNGVGEYPRTFITALSSPQ